MRHEQRCRLVVSQWRTRERIAWNSPTSAPKTPREFRVVSEFARLFRDPQDQILQMCAKRDREEAAF